MSTWHDWVGDLTLFEALTVGHLTVKTGNIAGNLTKIFQKSQMPRGLLRREWAVLELTGTLNPSNHAFKMIFLLDSYSRRSLRGI